MQTENSLNVMAITRVGMFIILGLVYYIPLASSDLRKTAVIIITILLIVNHFLQFHDPFQKWNMLFSWLDFAFITAFAFMFVDGGALYLIYYGVLAVTVFLQFDKKSILYSFIAAFLVIWLPLLLFSYISSPSSNIFVDLVSFMFVVHGAIVGGLIRKLNITREELEIQYDKLSHSHTALQDVHGQLQDYAKQVEQLTMIRERNKIARDIHDTVGHKMTALLIQLRVAKETITRDMSKSQQTVQLCEELAEHALQEIRMSVRAIQDESEEYSSFIDTLRTLIFDFSQSTGMDISLSIEGDPVLVSTSWQPVLLRITQESLTNAKRHGSATECYIQLTCQTDEVMLSIRDNGKGNAAIEPGFGLRNMVERVTELGGTIKYKSEEDSGFTVKVTLSTKKMSWRASVKHDNKAVSSR
ncbi:sensor histidine kinase [Bacillus salinus]|uniref:sensor histidine kinase n=1 Tax=Bacillus sp. HMF5848 TaxID=2495421 RepID=UPI00163A59D0|nr:sensor histidine kinase [Bacillus sp. HMF5848]